MPSDGLSEYFVDTNSNFQKAKCKQSYLGELAIKFGLSNITYFFLSGRALTGDTEALITTYPKAWKDHYFSMKYDEVDPIICSGMKSFLPIDWSQAPKTQKCAKRFFGEAKDFGISDQGVTIPVRAAGGETALVSLNADMAPAEWAQRLKYNISDFSYFSYLLHRELRKRTAPVEEIETTRLTRREREVLQWAALGKTSWETSKILMLSQRTVEFYLSNAMVKLSAATKVQAVSKAIHLGLILADASLQSPALSV